jgi:hypothetical protein
MKPVPNSRMEPDHQATSKCARSGRLQVDSERSVPVMWLKSSACVMLLLAVAACGEQGFTVRYAPGFSRTGKHVSVFGIKRDGLMNQAGWAALGPGLSAPFNGTSCDVAYSTAWFTDVPAIATSVDDYVRGNGVTDELLAQLAPAAKGDTIMLVTIAGHPLQPSAEAGSSIQAAAPPASATRNGRRRNRGGTSSTAPTNSSSSSDPFDVSATFFSVAEHRSVAVIELGYTGARIDEALNEFRNKLESEFPGATCSGWNWSVKLDEASIRKLNDM